MISRGPPRERGRAGCTGLALSESLGDRLAASDPFDLYNPDMAGPYGGIGRSGAPGSYAYSVQEGRENTPVTFGSIFDTMRFMNWLHNGQGAGGTESGVYELVDATTVISGRADAAEYFDGDFFNGIPFEQAPFSPVGWYTEAATYYGTFDQGGNVSEWLEDQVLGQNYGIRGGCRQWTPGLQDAGVTVYPNLFNPQTTVAFTVPQAGQVSVQVFDMCGRLVDTLVRGSRAAGEHRVAWDGRDASSRNVGAGVYLVRLVTPTSSTTERAMLVK